MSNNDGLVEVLVASINDCRAFTNELKDERKALKAELEKAAAGLASLLVERDSLQKQLSEALKLHLTEGTRRDELEFLKVELESRREELGIVQRERDMISKSLDQTDEQLCHALAERDARREERDAFEKQVFNLTTANKDLQARFDEADTLRIGWQRQADKARSELKHNQDATRSFREQMEDKLIVADRDHRNTQLAHGREVKNLQRDLRNMTLARDEFAGSYNEMSKVAEGRNVALTKASKRIMELEMALADAKK